MKVIVSPAKRMRVNPDSMDCTGLPVFLPQAEKLWTQLQKMSAGELKRLWKCNDRIAEENVERLKRTNLRSNLTPAVLAYDGIQYRYMGPDAFTQQECQYIQEHLRILSGLYGILRPFDGVVPYRLEMQARLETDRGKGLYAFWGDAIAQKLFEETDCIVNLASREYSICVSEYLPKQVWWITCVFGEEKDGKIIEKGTLCKMARGEMVRFMAENRIRRPEELKSFFRLGYRYSEEQSDENQYVFVHSDERRMDEY